MQIHPHGVRIVFRLDIRWQRDGILRVRGHVPTDPQGNYFTLKFHRKHVECSRGRFTNPRNSDFSDFDQIIAKKKYYDCM